MVLTPDQTRVVVGGSLHHPQRCSCLRHGVAGRDAPARVCRGRPTRRSVTAARARAITVLRTDGQQIYGSGYAYGTGNFEGTFAANPTTGAITVVNDCHGDTYDVLPVGTGALQRGPRPRLQLDRVASPTPVRGSGGSTRWRRRSLRRRPTRVPTTTAGTTTDCLPPRSCTGSPSWPTGSLHRPVPGRLVPGGQRHLCRHGRRVPDGQRRRPAGPGPDGGQLAGSQQARSDVRHQARPPVPATTATSPVSGHGLGDLRHCVGLRQRDADL